jgi:trafficking protein particle complex subunit 8
MSISKRWIGGGSRSSSGGGGGSGGNYDSLQGFYRPDSPEAQIRKLADYAFMLRDFKLAYNTYELGRSDFQSDKAWRHYAGANEMAALSALLMGTNTGNSTSSSSSSSSSSKAPRQENIDQCLETAVYSYVTRCMAPYSALRTTMMATELLRLRGASTADEAARWSRRALESKLVGPIGAALVVERISVCYSSRPGIGALKLGARRRKAGLWAVLATEEWLRLGKLARAEQCLAEARSTYSQDERTSTKEDESAPSGNTFERTIPPHILYLEDLGHRVEDMRRVQFSHDTTSTAGEGEEAAEQVDEVDEVAGESLQDDRRRHRRSLIGQTPAPFGGIDPVPLAKPRELDEQAEGAMGKGFE